MCAVFESFSSKIDKILSINPSADLFVLGAILVEMINLVN